METGQIVLNLDLGNSDKKLNFVIPFLMVEKTVMLYSRSS